MKHKKIVMKEVLSDESLAGNQEVVMDDFFIFIEGAATLNDEDKSFADKLAHDFKLNTDKMRMLIGEIRNVIDKQRIDNIYRRKAEEYKDTADYKEYYKKTVDTITEANLIDITIKTNKGVITIKPGNLFLPMFDTGLEEIRAKCMEAIDYIQPVTFDLENIKFLTKYILFSLHNFWKIAEFKKVVIAGRILIYFKIDNCNSILTEEEFEKSLPMRKIIIIIYTI